MVVVSGSGKAEHERGVEVNGDHGARVHRALGVHESEAEEIVSACKYGHTQAT